jgi:hypothetical protein
LNLRVLVAFGMLFVSAANFGFAADLPLLIDKTPPAHHKKKTILQAKNTGLKPQAIALLPASAKLPTEKLPTPLATPLAPQTTQTTNELSWVLGPMVANADGGKREGSASATANIIVDKPGTSFGPEIVIELEGHVVKTIQATVRLDIHIGSMKKTVLWNSDEIKAGIFKITMNEKVPPGLLPSLIPVSALAFVTQSGDSHAAMVSLEKIMLRFAKPQVASAQ